MDNIAKLSKYCVLENFYISGAWMLQDEAPFVGQPIVELTKVSTSEVFDLIILSIF